MDAFKFSEETHCFETYLNVESRVFGMPLKFTIDKAFIEKEYFENSKSQDEISKMLGVSQWVISQRMMEYGVQTRDRTWKLHNRKYSVNDNFFDEINPVNAWALGWLASDGFINENGNALRFGINLAEKDADLIYRLKKLLGYSGKVYHVKRKLENTGKEYKQVHLLISSKKIVKRLNEFGIVKNKTDCIGFPKLISDLHDEQITKSFIQGVFEGDGSILFDERTKSPCFQIVGTLGLLEGIQCQLMEYLHLKKTKLTNNIKGSNHFALRYRGRFQAMKAFDWLYSAPENYLKRKYKKYLNIKRRLNLCVE